MGKSEFVLAVDAGTQSVRAIVFDRLGNIVDMRKEEIEPPYTSPQPGWAEQGPETYWGSLCRACHGLWAQGAVKPEDIAGVAVTSQRGTVVNLDIDGNPLRDAIVWLDQRRAGKLPRVGGLHGAFFKVFGLGRTVRYFQSEAEINWIAEHQPDVWEKTAHYLLLSGYLNFRLTGEYKDSVACQVGYVPLDFKKQEWAARSDWKWSALNMKPGILPELTKPCEELGRVSRQASVVTGLPEGTRVISAASDKACEVAGAGCLAPDVGCIGYGTAATISIQSAKYMEPIMLAPSYPSAKPGCFNPEIQIFRGFWMVTWFKEQCAKMEQLLAKEQNIDAEMILEQHAAEVPPGSLGLTLQPYWTPGLIFPGLDAKGSIIGFGSIHHKEHIYRAILEGIAYGLRHGREMIEAKSGHRMKEIIVTGGGSKSDLMMQITADIFGIPAVRPKVSETSGLGAALLAAVGTGMYADYDEAVKHMTGRGDVFNPIPEHVEIYDRLYKEVYHKIYPGLKKIFRSIQQITGYPLLP